MFVLKFRTEAEVDDYYQKYQDGVMSTEEFCQLCYYAIELENSIPVLIHEHNVVFDVLTNDLEKYYFQED